MKHARFFPLVAFSALLIACGSDPEPQYGPDPQLPDPQRGLLPDMKIANPAEWGDQRPTVPQGYTIAAIATDLQIPRQTLVLPNGDILVAEGRGGGRRALTPKDVIAGIIKAKGTSPVPGGDRLTLLRDSDGDGSYERTIFADNLNAPYGLALVGGHFYVANQDALVRFDYRDGMTSRRSGQVNRSVFYEKEMSARDVTRAYAEWFEGYEQDPAEILQRTFREVGGYDDIVVLRDIPFESCCEHHMSAIRGTVSVGYLPRNRVVGISKLARVVDAFAHRLQVQERLTAQIADTIDEVLAPRGVGVIVKGTHACMASRGVRNHGVSMVTSRMLGAFRDDPAARQEFLAALA